MLLARRTPTPPNLLLVTIDTLRADRVSAFGYGHATTPVLDGLAARGARFARAQSASPLTGPSHATILTGHYPPVHGVRDNARFTIAAGSATLAERLGRAGYETAAFVGAFPVAGAFGFARGFSVFDEGFHATAQGQVAERPANEVADAALSWLRERRAKPFLAWVHFYDPHEPYAPPAAERARFAHPYDGEIAFADAQLGRLLEALRAAGALEQTLVVVVSDHGEGLGEHGESTHGLLLYESTLHVPLVMAGPGIAPARVVEDRVGTIDVLPTLLSLLGLPRPEGLPGRDLRPALAGRSLRPEPLYAESLYGRLNCRWAPLRAWTEGGFKLVAGRHDELFDLRADSREQGDLAAAQPERAGRLRAALDRAVTAMAPGGDRAAPARLSAEQTEALRALGYVAGGGGGGAVDDPRLSDPRDHVRDLERLRALGGAAGAAVGPALDEAVALARADPGNPLVHEVVAGLAFRSGRLGLAAEALGRFVEIEPERGDVLARRGDLLRTLGRLEEAERDLRRAITLGSAAAAAARVALAETLIARGQLAEAESLLAAVLARAPRDRAALVAQARLRQAQGRPEEALAGLEAAAQGGDAEAVLELSEALAQASRPLASRQAAERVLAASPVHPWALALVGHALAVEGRRAEGEAALQQALRAGPRRPQVWLRLAAGFEAAGRGDLARRCRSEAGATRWPVRQ
ncbi:MAG: sulfatase-like hydrolase/transferase [Vicinamibacteria bacterium]